jgi:hypothetical protein
LTLLPITVPAPSRLTSSSMMRRSIALPASGAYLSRGSRGRMRTPSWSAKVLMSETRAIGSAWTKAARLRFTSEAICCAVCTARGSNSSARKVCSQATIDPISRSDKRKKVRQNSESPSRGRISRGAGAVSSGAGLVGSTWVALARIISALERSATVLSSAAHHPSHQPAPSGTNT